MSTSISDFKVFVSEEIFDFRTFHGQNMNNKTKERPHSVCKCDTDDRTKKIDVKIINANAAEQKVKKTKPRLRSRTVDPRFRRSRSPTLQNMNTTQSTNTINRLFKARINQNDKPVSISSPAINNQNCTCTDSQVRRNCNKAELAKKDKVLKVPDVITEKELSFMEGNCNSVSNWDNKVKNNSDYEDKRSTNKIEVISDVNCDIPCTIEEELNYSDILNSTKLEEETTSKTCLKKPYWEDTRYLITEDPRKILARNNLHFLTKSLNYPGTVFCHISPCNNDQNFTTYKYDQGSEVCSCSLIHDEDAISLRSEFCVSSSIRSVFCSIIGMSLLSFIIWIVLNFNLEEKNSKQMTEPDSIIIYYYNQISEYFKNVINIMGSHNQETQSSYWWNII